MNRCVVIVYRGVFHEFDLAQEFVDEAEARAFARTRRTASSVILPGSVEDWFNGRVTSPIAIYCQGREYRPE